MLLTGQLDAEMDEEVAQILRSHGQGTSRMKKKSRYNANRSDKEEDEGQILAQRTGGREAKATEKKAKTKTLKNGPGLFL